MNKVLGVDIKLKFKTRFDDRASGNKFLHLPKSLATLLHTQDGLMSGIVDELYPDRDYEISIRIKELKSK